MRTLSLLVPLIALAAVLPASAAVKTEIVEYKDGDQVCEGFLAYDDAAKGKRPGVVVVHEWMGLGDYAKGRATKLAELGYVAFAADIYGKGIRAKDAKEAGALAGKFKGDLPLLRSRAKAAFDTLAKNGRVDTAKIFAIGYCFGGTTALELARSGAPVAGVVSFHGGDDPYVPPEQVQAFWDEMKKARVDYQLVVYGGAVHSFTSPEAGNDPSKGAAYDEKADKRSWEAMKAFFAELFR